MRLDVITSNGRNPRPDADEVAAIVAVLEDLDRGTEPVHSAPSRWRAAARSYEGSS